MTTLGKTPIIWAAILKRSPQSKLMITAAKWDAGDFFPLGIECDSPPFMSRFCPIFFRIYSTPIGAFGEKKKCKFGFQKYFSKQHGVA